jgi:hypothetical protein
MFVVVLALVTVLMPILVWQTVRLWFHRTTFFDLPADQPSERARVRTAPAVMASLFPFLIGAWILVIDHPVPHKVDALQRLPLVHWLSLRSALLA